MALREANAMWCRRVLAVLVGLMALGSHSIGVVGQVPASTLIRNAVVVDGLGTPGRRVDVRLVGDRITEVGELTRAADDRVIDAGGRTLAPGFIDTHSHHDRGLLDRRDALAAVSQGITTIVVGQDGSSPLPLAEFFEALEESPAAVNVASYVGHGTLRRQVLADDFRRPAREDELAEMRALLRREMEAGALGLSTGLEYDPGIYSETSEVVSLARVAGSYGGRYISHMRSEDRRVWEAVAEAVEIGRQAGIPVQISHLKLAMLPLWGEAGRLVEVLEEARRTGVDVTADVYPYTYWQSTMRVLFPDRDFANRASAAFALRELVAPEGLLIVDFEPDPTYVGRTLADIAATRATDPVTTMMDLLREAGTSGPGVVATSMDERDVAVLLAWPFANVCSDGALAGAHPRGFGAFPRVLGRLVRQQGVLSIEEAVRKMTSLAAANVGLGDRGAIEVGRFADLVLFDPETIVDRATTADPQAPSVGIDTVWLNGDVVYDDGQPTGRYTGRVIRRQ